MISLKVMTHKHPSETMELRAKKQKVHADACRKWSKEYVATLEPGKIPDPRAIRVYLKQVEGKTTLCATALWITTRDELRRTGKW